MDTNSRYIARRLTEIGVEVVEMLSVPDRREEIYNTVDYAMGAADLIVVTGGLGPTKDDVTKKVLAEYFGMRLVENREALGWLEELLRNRSLPMNEGNRSQAWLPEGCRVLRNVKGTAPGMWFEKGWKSLISLPGVPFEMEDLMDRCVVPELKAKYPGLQLEYRMLDNAPEVNLYMEYSNKACLDNVLKLFRDLELKVLNMEITRSTETETHNACALFTLAAVGLVYNASALPFCAVALCAAGLGELIGWLLGRQA